MVCSKRSPLKLRLCSLLRRAQKRRRSNQLLELTSATRVAIAKPTRSELNEAMSAADNRTAHVETGPMTIAGNVLRSVSLTSLVQKIALTSGRMNVLRIQDHATIVIIATNRIRKIQRAIMRIGMRRETALINDLVASAMRVAPARNIKRSRDLKRSQRKSWRK